MFLICQVFAECPPLSFVSKEAFNASYAAGAMKALDSYKEVDLEGEWVLDKSVPLACALLAASIINAFT